MWNNEILQTLLEDALALQKNGARELCDALRYLAGSIQTATVVAPTELPPTDLRPKLFLTQDYPQKALLPAHTLLVTFYDAKRKMAALFAERSQTLEMYIFRYKEEYERWLWPMIGLAYGPHQDQINQIAVYPREQLQNFPKERRSAILVEHSTDAALALRHLAAIQRTSTRLATPPKPILEPSSFARKRRTQHKKKRQGKGSRAG